MIPGLFASTGCAEGAVLPLWHGPCAQCSEVPPSTQVLIISSTAEELKYEGSKFRSDIKEKFFTMRVVMMPEEAT